MNSETKTAPAPEGAEAMMHVNSTPAPFQAELTARIGDVATIYFGAKACVALRIERVQRGILAGYESLDLGCGAYARRLWHVRIDSVAAIRWHS